MKNLHSYYIIFIFLLLSNILFSQEYRAEFALSYTINQLQINTELQGRTGFNENQSYNSGLAQLGIEYELGKRIDMGMAYRYAFTEENAALSENSIDYENKNRLTIDLGINLKRFENDLKIKNRLRYQMNIDDDGDQKSYIREKISLDYKLSNLWSPYSAIEVYYQAQKNQINAFRLYIGSEIDMNQHKLDFFYILEADIDTKTELFYILGMNYKFKL